jgi:catechol 2,3-dioxygenase-like lactoylglutathione lyase family enzyme
VTLTYKLGLLKVPVTDVEASAAFYRDQLGLELHFAVGAYGWAQLGSGELLLALYEPGRGGGDGSVGGSTGFHLELPADEFEVLAARLAAAGVLVGGAVQRSDDGSEFLEACDPDGNTTKVLRRAD